MLRRLVVAALIVIVGVLIGGRVAAEPPPPDTVPTTENVFLPESGEVTECVSALPKPGCGSDAKGGWRQWLIFVVMGVALAFIGWRIVRAIRRQRAPDEVRV